VIYELIQMINSGILFFIPGKGNKQLSFTYIDDVIDALLLAASHGKINNIYIICSGSLTVTEWIQNISKAVGRFPPL
jgi:nucleoside-diphosphate-sugar epimerase